MRAAGGEDATDVTRRLGRWMKPKLVFVGGYFQQPSDLMVMLVGKVRYLFKHLAVR